NSCRNRRRERGLRGSRDDLLARPCVRRHTCRASDSCYRVRLGQSSFAQAQRENQLEDYRESNLITELTVRQEEGRHLVLPAAMNCVGGVPKRVGEFIV